MDEKVIMRVEDVYEQVSRANSDLYDIWKEQLLFTFEWWIALALIIIPWTIWIILHKRQSRSRLLFAGFFVIIVACWLDFTGSTNGLWYYPMEIIPTIPSYLMWDMSLMPVIIMLLLQYTNKYNPFLIGVIFAFIVSFLAEPFFEWIDFYRRIHWKHIYSFPIYAIIYVITYYISKCKTFDPL
jgi:xanthine/uracil permease